MVVNLANGATLNASSVTKQFLTSVGKFSLNISLNGAVEIEKLIGLLTPENCATITIPEKGRVYEGYTHLTSMQERISEEINESFITLEPEEVATEE